jgi:hypothetical protein
VPLWQTAIIFKRYSTTSRVTISVSVWLTLPLSPNVLYLGRQIKHSISPIAVTLQSSCAILFLPLDAQLFFLSASSRPSHTHTHTHTQHILSVRLYFRRSTLSSTSERILILHIFPAAGESFTFTYFILADVHVRCYQPSLSSLNSWFSRFCFIARKWQLLDDEFHWHNHNEYTFFKYQIKRYVNLLSGEKDSTLHSSFSLNVFPIALIQQSLKVKVKVSHDRPRWP